MSEEYFRDILADLREFGSLRRPPTICPHLAMIAMVFTARYDYKGAFWKPFQENLGTEELDQHAWGAFFRRMLANLDLFSPPQHWMINVFPVLYHAIIPEASKVDFAIMVRSLNDEIDIRDLDDDALLAAVRSYDLPMSLRAFIDSAESAPVACDLIRQVSEDYRQLPSGNRAPIETTTIRGALLASVLDAPISERRRFILRDRLLMWRWNLSSGEIGAHLTGNTTFDDPPLRLRLGGKSYDLEYYADGDGRWSLASRLIPIPMSLAGEKGLIKFASGASESVRLAKAAGLPLFFRASSSVGTLVNASPIEAGIYAIASAADIRVTDEEMKEIAPLEILPRPHVPGVCSAQIFELNEGETVQTSGLSFTVQGRMRPAAVISKTSLWSLIGARGDRVPVYAEPPRIRFESPLVGSIYKITERLSNRVVATGAFVGRDSVKPELSPGSVYQATVLVDGRASGASSVDFAILPIHIASSSQFGLNGALFGHGTIVLEAQALPLSDSAVPVAPDVLFAVEPLNYQYEARSYRIQFVGPQPVMWRIGARRFAQTRLLCDMADVAEGRCIEFRGTPGAAVTLCSDAATFTETIGPDGRLQVPLSRFAIAIAGDHLDINIVELDISSPCITIVGAPVAHYNSIGLESSQTYRFAVGGEVALDRSVDRMQLVLERHRQPWIGQERVDLEGFARSWEIHCTPTQAEYRVTLVADLDGREASVLDGDGKIWSKILGQAYASRDPFDSQMYSALSGHQAAIESISRSPASRTRALELCANVLALASSSFEHSIRILYSRIGEHMRAGELTALSCLAARKDKAIEKFAAVAGLPVAAAPQRLTRWEPALQSQGVAGIIQVDFLKWLLNTAKSVESVRQATAAIDMFADDPSGDELVRAYAAFLRLTLATDLITQLERLESEIEKPVVSRARLQASELILDSRLPLAVILNLEPAGPMFGKWVSALWAFAIVARLAPRMAPEAPVPKGALLISRWAYDSAVGSLAIAILSRADAICVELHDQLEIKPC